jgi:hypothetical protein
MHQSQSQSKQEDSTPVAPATAEVIQGLRDKCEKAPKHGVNGKYLIIQAARLLAQQEQARQSGRSDAGVSAPPLRIPCTHPNLLQARFCSCDCL